MRKQLEVKRQYGNMKSEKVDKFGYFEAKITNKCEKESEFKQS